MRKAFLELDENHSGWITAEELAKFLGASKDKNFDFTLMEILIKLKTSGMKTRVYYKDFCSWLGSSIEPTEGFYFRHDSKKNPQYEINLMRNIENRGPSQNEASHIITKGDLKERFVARTFSTYKTLKKAYAEWKLPGCNYFDYPKFEEMMTTNWGFRADSNQIKELYNWMDGDKDGKISFEDLRQSVGQDVSPME